MPATDWSGLYAGAHIGYSWTDIETSDSSITTDGTVFGLPVFPFQQFMEPGADDKGSADGVFGGLQAGYQLQWQQIVAGIEADINWTDADHKNEIFFAPLGPTYDTKAEMEYFGTVRGRAGYAFDNFLLYGTGGLAYGKAKGSVAVTPGAVPVGPTFSGSDSAYYVGYVVGGGIEVALTKSISMKVEYLHMDLGDENLRFDLKGSGGSFAETKADIEMDSVTLGLNYHF